MMDKESKVWNLSTAYKVERRVRSDPIAHSRYTAALDCVVRMSSTTDYVLNCLETVTALAFSSISYGAENCMKIDYSST